MEENKCRLCHEDRPLVRSHLVPAAAYRLLRNSSSGENPIVGRPGKEPIASSAQYQARLLCCDCEDRFNKFGERWIFKHGLQGDGRFPLRSLLRSESPNISWPTKNPTRIYYSHRFATIKHEAISFFAASIFWRASIHDWDRKFHAPVKLGKFSEQFRRYLLGTEDFPTDAALWVFVREESIADYVLHAPTMQRGDGFYVHTFTMPGFHFMLFVGSGLETIHRQLCFVRGASGPILMSPFSEEKIEWNTRRLVPGSIIEI